MKKIFLIAFCSLQVCYASFQEIYQLEEIAPSESALVVFDIDEVLMVTEDQFLHPYSDEDFNPLFARALSMGDTPEEKALILDKLSLSILQPRRKLTQKNVPAFLLDLQKHNIETLALTSCPTGPFGLIPSIEMWRIDHLEELGVHFSLAKQFPSLSLDKGIYANGVLFSNGHNKGEVLTEFLKETQIKPDHIVFIDNLQHNLEDVEKAMTELEIPFTGYLYRGAEKYFKTRNAKLLETQLEHLLENDNWLPDEHAAVKLHSEKTYEGTLKQLKSGFTYVDIPKNILEDMLPHMKNIGFNPPPYSGHITVLKESNVLIPEQTISFTIKELEFVTLKNSPLGSEAALITVDAPQLEELRASLDLPKKINGHEFHITVGTR